MSQRKRPYLASLVSTPSFKKWIVASAEKDLPLVAVTAGAAVVPSRNALESGEMILSTLRLQQRGDEDQTTISSEDALRQYIRIYNVSFQKGTDNLEDDKRPVKEDLPAGVSYYFYREARNSGSNNDFVSQKDVGRILDVCEHSLNPGGHAHVFCSQCTSGALHEAGKSCLTLQTTFRHLYML